jgi:hypothetical protein
VTEGSGLRESGHFREGFYRLEKGDFSGHWEILLAFKGMLQRVPAAAVDVFCSVKSNHMVWR